MKKRSADVLSGRHFVRTALDVLSGRRFVRTAFWVISRDYEWLRVEWGGFRVVLGDFGWFWWLRVVMGSYGVDTGGYWWLWLVMVWYRVFTGGYH